jgi:phosphotransferase system HPr (HPr) family protein
MIQQEFTIQNKVGLHARPAAVFVQTTVKFKSNIIVEKDGKEINAKSIIGVLSLGAEKGSKIIIKIEGEDEQEAMKALKELVHNNFGEDQ